MRGASSSIFRDKQMPPLSAMTTVEMLTTLDGQAVIVAKARCWSKIASLPQLAGPSRNIAIRFSTEKLELWVYQMMKKV